MLIFLYANFATYHVGDVVYVTTSVVKKPTVLQQAFLCLTGAGEMNRTPDLLITNELLYRLSYTGLCIFLRLISHLKL